MKKLSKRKIEQLHETLQLKQTEMKLKYSDPFSFDPLDVLKFKSSNTEKKLKVVHENNEEEGTLKRTIIANTYNWLDNHDDVHLSGVFSRSIDHKGVKIPHLHDHEFKIAARIGKMESVSEHKISWMQLGVNKRGSTEALVIVSQIKEALNKTMFNAYKDDEINQHSVGMRYIGIDLAINDEQEKEEFAVWQEVFPLIGNKEKAERQGFFFAVREAELIEVSAVLAGSNELTPTLGSKSETADSTSDDSEGDRKSTPINVLESINKFNFKLKL